jgi:hypothetical protein
VVRVPRSLRGCPTEVIAASEREIFNIQRATRFDPYWRLYFLLTGEAS